MQLGLRVAQGATFDCGNLAMLKTMDIVKEENIAIAGRQSSHSPIDGQAVNNTGLSRIANAKTPPRAFLISVCHEAIERNNGKHALAQPHQHDIDCHPVKPCGESGVTAKSRELPVQLKKGFLREIFGNLEIMHHAQTN
jgi:hypothetical protein